MTDKQLLAEWAIKCSERVLPIFEKAHPDDPRPRRALEVLQEWIDGKINCTPARAASLEAHAAARDCREFSPEYLAARACGQAVATAHAMNHAIGAAYYAAKVVASIGGSIEDEVRRQRSILPDQLKYKYDESKAIHFAERYKKC